MKEGEPGYMMRLHILVGLYNSETKEFVFVKKCEVPILEYFS